MTTTPTTGRGSKLSGVGEQRGRKKEMKLLVAEVELCILLQGAASGLSICFLISFACLGSSRSAEVLADTLATRKPNDASSSTNLFEKC